MSARKANKKTSAKKRYWLFLLLKIAIILLIIIIGYGVYLDNKIRSRIDGHVWQLPAAVYSRMVNLEPGMAYSQPEMAKLLNGMQYRQVTQITRPGEFTVQGNRINLLRRPFAFPDGKEGQIAAQLVFDNDHLTRIINQQTQRDYGLFRIDPRLITMLQSPNGVQRLFVARSGFPSLLIDTLIATEDRHFYQHDGISLTSIGRAFLANLTAGRLVQGGSTLTQQLVKNLFLTNKRSLWRKINEAYMAILVDYRYSKDRILELYLNEVYLGQSGPDQIRGFPLASLYYFGRPVDELSLDQQALLVGMVKGASLYNPWRNPQLALERRNVVLKLLLEQKIIDQQLYDTLSARPLGVQPKGGVISPQPAFMQLVRQELQDKLGEQAEHLSGARIFTTLDPVSQDAAENAVEQGVPELKKLRKLADLEAAMVVVDRHSGEVRAMVGGAQPQFSGFNRAMSAVRSIGSLAKPPTYLTALGLPDQYRLNTWLPDNPLALKLANGQVWQPKNDNRRFTGQVMLLNALAHSMNIPTINLGMNVGLPQIIDTWQKLGVDKSAINPVPAMLLGALNLTPMQVAQAYQTIAGGGNRAMLSALRTVMDENGKPLYQSYPQAQQVLAPQAAYLTLYAMQQVVAQGTGRSLNARYANYHLAGKTGTTNDLRDSWFAGIDGKEVVISWIGRDNNQPTRFSGASGALVIYRDYLANSTPLPLQLVAPVGINNLAVDAAGNFLCDSNSPQKADMLPVWTDQPQTVCQLKQQQPIPAADASSSANNSSGDAPQWVKDMFG